jgi:hypothetical protein
MGWGEAKVGCCKWGGGGREQHLMASQKGEGAWPHTIKRPRGRGHWLGVILPQIVVQCNRDAVTQLQSGGSVGVGRGELMNGILKGGPRQGNMSSWWATAMGMGTVRVKGGLHGIPFTKDVDEHHAGSEITGAHVMRCCCCCYGGTLCRGMTTNQGKPVRKGAGRRRSHASPRRHPTIEGHQKALAVGNQAHQAQHSLTSHGDASSQRQ